MSNQFIKNITLMLALSLFVIIATWQTSLIYAHPIIVDSVPKQFQTLKEPPDRVVIVFSEPIELDYSKISVKDVNGKEVKIGNQFNKDQDKSTLVTKLQSNLSEGSYFVSSKVLSAVDGHVVDNSFTFNIGKEADFSGKDTTVNKGILDLFSLHDSLARFPGYFGQILFFGIIFLNMWLWIPFSRIGKNTTEFVRSFKVDIENKLIKAVIISLLLILLSIVLMIIVQSHILNTSVHNILTTKFGNILIIRLILVLTSLIFSIFIFKKRLVNKSDPVISSKVTFIFIVMGLLLFLNNSFISHASATNKIVALGLDFFHMFAASVWIGGILFLTSVVMPQIKKREHNFEKYVLTVLLIPRFSIIVVIILGSISITGPVLLWFIENNLSYISSSLYGIILLIKITLAIIMISIGGYHQFVTEKKFALLLGIEKNRLAKMKPDIHKNITRFSNNLKIESVLGIGLIFIVSILTNMVLPASENIANAYYNDEELFFKNTLNVNSEFFKSTDMKSNGIQIKNLKLSTYSSTDDSKKIELQIPAILGENKFKLSFIDETGKLDSDIMKSTIKITNIDENVGPIKVTGEKIVNGIFTGNLPLNIPGIWTLEIQGITSKLNELNYIGIFHIKIKPKLNELNFKINEFKMQNNSLLLNLVFDKKTNSIWSGDTTPGTGQIIQFEIDDKKYTNHKINGTYLISILKIDPKNSNNLWYLDPVSKSIGIYDMKNKIKIMQEKVPTNGPISGLTIDGKQDVWLTTVQDNSIMKFDHKTELFQTYEIPTKNSKPVNIVYDNLRDLFWFTESVGKIAKLDPNSGIITEYSPKQNGTIKLEEPSEIFIDKEGKEIYITDHKLNQVITFSPILEIFSNSYSLDNKGLAFGMVQDNYNNLWIAQHITDSLFVLNPETEEIKKIDVPTRGSFIQHLTVDDKGRIWFAEQRGNGLGNIVITVNPSQQIQDTSRSELSQQELSQKRENSFMNFISAINLRFVEMIGILIITGTVISTIVFKQIQRDLENKINILKKIDEAYHDYG